MVSQLVLAASPNRAQQCLRQKSATTIGYFLFGISVLDNLPFKLS